MQKIFRSVLLIKHFSPSATTVGLCFSQGKGGKHGLVNFGNDYQARIKSLMSRIWIIKLSLYRVKVVNMDWWMEMTTRWENSSHLVDTENKGLLTSSTWEHYRIRACHDKSLRFFLQGKGGKHGIIGGMDYQVWTVFSLQKIKDYFFREKVVNMDSWITWTTR